MDERVASMRVFILTKELAQAMNRMRLLSTAVLATVIGVGAAVAAAPEACDKYLSVELTPDVPNPRDLAFLSSLLTVPGYQLVWRQQNGTAVELELTGPGPEDQCRNVIAAMRKDGRIRSISVHN